MAEEQIAAVERALVTRIGNLESLVAAIDTRFRENTLELANSRENMGVLITQLQEKLKEQDDKYTELAVTVADFCYKGPEEVIQAITKDPLIIYYVTCNGTNPLSQQFDESRNMVRAGGTCLYSYTYSYN